MVSGLLDADDQSTLTHANDARASYISRCVESHSGSNGSADRIERETHFRGYRNQDGGDRSGRRHPCSGGATASGQIAGYRVAKSRILSVEVLELGNRGESSKGASENFVYDIEVEGNHNFFSNRALVHNCMVRRLKSDVLKELPAKRRQIVTLPADGCEKQIAAEISAQAALDARLESLRAAVELSKAQDDDAYLAAVAALRDAGMVAFTEISKIRHETALAKLPMVIAHVRDQIDAGAKLVLFAHHHDIVNALAVEFGSCAVTLTGADSMEHRQASVDRFQSDPTCALCIGTIPDRFLSRDLL